MTLGTCCDSLIRHNQMAEESEGAPNVLLARLSAVPHGAGKVMSDSWRGDFAIAIEGTQLPLQDDF